MLAPLMDGMTTRDLTRRFTASQALQFFEDFYPQLSNQVLDTTPPKQSSGGAFYDEVDRWSHLPDDFLRVWSHLREPKLPLWSKLLRRICEADWGYVTVQWVRRFTRFVYHGFTQ